MTKSHFTGHVTLEQACGRMIAQLRDEQGLSQMDLRSQQLTTFVISVTSNGGLKVQPYEQ
jgi:hypothetical protein